jgi:pyruvate, water dikinase
VSRTTRAAAAWAAGLLLLACAPACDQGSAGPRQVCDLDAPEGPSCLQSVDTEDEWLAIARDGQVTKFMLPARDEPQLLPLVFQNSRRWELHIEFLRAAFPELFGDLSFEGYQALVMRRATRDYYAGGLQTLPAGAPGCRYGYTLWTDLVDSGEQLAEAEVRDIHRELSAAFHLEGLAYSPVDPEAIDAARNWLAPDFPVCLLGDEVQTEVYTAGVAYGVVRRLDLGGLEDGLRRGELSWRDILVLDRVPVDVEAVVAAVVTGGRQWELSHVNVRMARRGTPNLYVRDAHEAFAALDGQLVRLEAIRGLSSGGDRYRVAPATQAEAEAWWATHRPSVSGLEPADPSELRLLGLLEMQGELGSLVRQFGGKASNLAVLYRTLPAEHRVPGFGVPLGWFEEFMAATRAPRPGGGTESLRERVARLAADPRMLAEARYRREQLWDLRARIEHTGAVRPERLQALEARLVEVFGAPTAKARFRSSSNVEDALEFSGAGLYSSTSACAADGQDADRDGPSRCDPALGEERTAERGLRRVWASLYQERAWLERDWYQVPQTLAGMGLLVNLAFPDERANGVAFTGNPDHGTDSRYLVNAQLGDQPVVGNDAAMVPEKDLLQVVDGQVTGISRARASALSPAGQPVVTDQELGVLGALLAGAVQDYPVDPGAWGLEKVLLDLEFKLVGAPPGRLAIKQIRTFLDKCRGVVCNTPPPARCLDASTLEKYAQFGTCDAVLGSCRHEVSLETCEDGCADGACL